MAHPRPPQPPSEGFAPPPGATRIVIIPSHTPLAALLEFFGTTVQLNGQPPIMGGWDQIPIDVPPGRHHVRVSTRYRGEYGAAETTVDVRPGETATVYYRSPALSTARGAIGSEPQRTPGIRLLWGLAALFVLFLAIGVTLVMI